MNKLNDLIQGAARLAAQQPNPDDVLGWKRPELSRAFAAWAEDVIDMDAAALLIDAPLAVVAARTDCPQETTLIACARSLPGIVPAGFSVSQRLPVDLSSSDEEVMSRVREATSLIAVQRALSGGAQAAWVATDSCDQVVAPFILNSLTAAECARALAEMVRVLRTTGVFQSVVLAADEPLTGRELTVEDTALIRFPLESQIAADCVAAGLHGVTLTPLLDGPFVTIGGVELRAFALTAHVGTAGVCLEQGDAAIYLGPWSAVSDDDGHTYPRGTRIAVCAKTAGVLQRAPYAGRFAIIAAYDRPDLADALPFDCSQDVVRPVAETKGRVPLGSSANSNQTGVCTDEGCDC